MNDEEIHRMALGAIIKHLRTKKGIGQKFFAHSICSQAQLVRFEKGTVAPRSDQINKMELQLGLHDSLLRPIDDVVAMAAAAASTTTGTAVWTWRKLIARLGRPAVYGLVEFATARVLEER